MLKRAGIGFFVLLLVTTMLSSAASARNIDCTGKSGTLNCPKTLERAPSGPNAGKYIIVGTAGDDLIRGSRAKVGDLMQGAAGNDRLIGERGNDVLRGGEGNDRLDGSGDDDLLLGEGGNDTLAADSGRDRLVGGIGDDTYFIPRGRHVIADASGNDRLRLTRASSEGTTFERVGKDLVIGLTDGEIRIENHFGAGNVETIQLEAGRETLRIPANGSQVALTVAESTDVKGGKSKITVEGKALEIKVEKSENKTTVTVTTGKLDITFEGVIEAVLDFFSPKDTSSRGGGGGGNDGGGGHTCSAGCGNDAPGPGDGYGQFNDGAR